MLTVLVIREVHKDLPSFERIKQIICVNGREISSSCSHSRQLIGLDEHFYAYSVEPDLTAANALTIQARFR